MPQPRTAVQEAWTTPVLSYLSGYLAVMVGIFFLLYWLFQPATIVNAGVAAYSPPAMTRLEPAPRKMDAPELVELEPLPQLAPSPLQALAKGNAETSATTPKEARKRSRKRPRAEAQVEIEQPRWGYAPDRDARRGQDNRYRQNDRYRNYDRYRQRNEDYRGNYRSWW